MIKLVIGKCLKMVVIKENSLVLTKLANILGIKSLNKSTASLSNLLKMQRKKPFKEVRYHLSSSF